MIEITPALIMTACVIFCRLGGCFLIMPGLSSPRIPAMARLFVAVAIALALTPVLADDVLPVVTDASRLQLLAMLISESLKGVVIGLLGRIFWIALETMAMSVSLSIGLTSDLTAPMDGTEPLPAIVTLVSLGAVALLFISDLHWELIRGLSASYHVLRVNAWFEPRESLTELVDAATSTFLLTLRIAAPFLVFSLIVNVAVGLINKLVPQIPVSFVVTPFLLAGGLLLLVFTIKPALDMFIAAFAVWLKTG